MVVATKRAMEALLELRLLVRLGPETGFRLTPDASGNLGLVVDTPRTGDQIVEYGGSAVLFIGEKMSQALTGAKIDCQDGGRGKVELVITKSPGGAKWPS